MKELMLGNKAVARGAYECGVRVVTAYPGTPSTEIAEEAAKYDEIYAQWSPNEKVAMEVAIGAAISGARAMVCMKHVGLNVAADPLFTVSYTGINAGLVIVVADDPGMHSSQNEQDSRYYAKAAALPMLEPSDSQEAKDFVKLAFEISEQYDTPVILRLTTRVSHSQSVVELEDRMDISLKDYKKDFRKYVMMPAMARERHVNVDNRMKDLSIRANDMDINTVEINDGKIGIITSGIAYQYAKEVLPTASFLKLGMVHPLPDKLIQDFSQKVDTLYVIEELEPFLEEYIKSLGVRVTGKEMFPRLGELSADIIKEKLLGTKGETGSKQPADKGAQEDIPLRPPVLCPGCPHRGVFYVLNKLKLRVTGDIGCYTLGVLPPLQSIDTCVCMGASIGMAFGMELGRGREFARNLVAVIGDSTFIHSGITGLIDMVYNGSTGTVIILDNSTTGMTGHQDHPATGCTLKGKKAPMLNLEALVKALGVKRVTVVDPFDLKELENAVRTEIRAEEPSVIISRRPCALLDKNKECISYHCDAELCINCRLCLRMGCPAIENIKDGIRINNTLCSGCGLCAQVCRPGAIKREE